ncbi:MAG TPA: hypothetical protein VN947_28145 [Polyangia bacterium]|nr:hypothetical protein [Polyangia bacterium]
MKLPFMDTLGSVGLVGERKALALLCLGFYTTLFFMIGLSARTELPEWVPVFSAMTLMYALAFFSVAAEWFWGRWFATGLGYWGMTMTIMAWVTTRSLPMALVIFGSMHAIVSLCLGGEKMAALFDAKPAWRARWKLDDQGVIRVRKSVTRAASSLPALIMFALAPREGQMLLGLTAFALAIVGFGGVLVARTYGVMALGASAAVLAALAIFGAAPSGVYGFFTQSVFFAGSDARLMAELGAWAPLLLLAATLPFAKPMAAYVLRRR